MLAAVDNTLLPPNKGRELTAVTWRPARQEKWGGDVILQIPPVVKH